MRESLTFRWVLQRFLLQRSQLAIACAALLAVGLVSILGGAVRAQDNAFDFGGGVGVPAGDAIKATGYFTATPDGKFGRLYIEATAQPTWHFYSTTQGPGGPLPSKLKVTEAGGFRVTGEFTAHTKPKVHPEEAFAGLLVEEYSQALWSAPIEFDEGTDVKELLIAGAVNAQVCQTGGSCLPPTDYKFTAAFKEVAEGEGAGTYKPEASHLEWIGKIDRKQVAAGGQVVLSLTAATEPGWHIYQLGDAPSEKLGPQPTLIRLRDLPPGWSVSIKPSKDAVPGDDGSRPYYDGQVEFAISVKVPIDTKEGVYPISGLVAFATCNDEGCTPPEGLEFSREITVTTGAAAGGGPLDFRAVEYEDVTRLFTAQDADQTLQSPASSESLWWVFGAALLGGLILNAMPCVLPVIGLKVLAVVDKSGHDRKKVFALNVVYSLGIIIVFLILAGLSVMLNMAWGEQFQSTAFNVCLAALVWVMALSFLGVWEIPIPGFVGGSEANKLQDKEGYGGAFFRGVFTTLLATPCSGPFLGATFGYTLGQPAHVTFTIFALIGIGMSAPYLLIGAYPKLVAWLPKPGAWMETFKQFMGFVLLGTVAFLLTFINSEYRTAVFALLIALWFACWLIGRVPITASPGRKARAWVIGATVAGGLAVVLFGNVWGQTELDWEPYTAGTLAKYQSEGKTVMVDFTADWCLNCKTVEAFALNQPETKALVDENEVVTLKADWTDYNEEIRRILNRHGSNSIPVLMIFPADDPENPIVLRDIYTKATLLENLKKAGPSKIGNAPATQTAMRQP